MLGENQLRIIFNIDGHQSTLDSPNQNAFGIPATSVFMENSVVIEVPSIEGVYKGKLENGKIVGTWEQTGQVFELILSKADKSPDKSLAKRLTGEIKLPGGAGLNLTLKVYEDIKGNLSATMDSPDQGAYGIKVSQIILDDESLKFEVESIQGDYSGTYNPDSGFYAGTWKQAGSELPLNLKENYEEEEILRPQEPERPFPYREENVSIFNKKAKINLAGTLTYPDSGKNFPAVVLISGSGPQNRDEEIFNHKPFLIISDYLTRNGIAVLRYDDRGVGESEGVFSEATTEDFSYDAEAALEFLKTRKEIDTSTIGLIGHSEGGLIAPMIANRNDNVDFIILMAGPGLPGDSIILRQSKLLMEAGGASEADIAKASELQKRIIDIVHSETDTLVIREKVVTAIKEMLEGTPEGEGTSETMIEAQAKRWVNNWMIYFLKYDPRPALRKIDIPVLAMIGEKDMQVTSEENLSETKKALEKSEASHFKLKELEGLNHLFQTAETGSTSEYGQIEETISPKALEMILNFIKENAALK